MRHVLFCSVIAIVAFTLPGLYRLEPSAGHIYTVVLIAVSLLYVWEIFTPKTKRLKKQALGPDAEVEDVEIRADADDPDSQYR